jgi:uncharacterized protein YkwD
MTTVKAPTFAASVNRLIVALRTILVVGLVACAETARTPSEPGNLSKNHARRAKAPNPDGWVLRTASTSPEPAPPDPELSLCGEFDGALNRVAERIAERSARGLEDYTTEELAFALRMEGEPHVWPEAWLFSWTAPRDVVAERASRWLETLHSSGARRCGVGRAKGSDGAHVTALVAVGALADLSPMPTAARLGQWISFSATMLARAEQAYVIVLPPTGPPRNVPTTIHGSAVRATFSADRSGPWLVQLLAVVQGGPRPVLEAALFVDDTPIAPTGRSVPGEAASAGARDEREALERMINAARHAENVEPLAVSAGLARIATEQARAMRDAGVLAHDLGDGGLVDRLRRAGMEVAHPGENVAHAKSVERAHRLLWASPSHRGNLLDPGFSKFAVGVARGADGSVWVSEVFADSDAAGIEHPASEH